MSDSNQSTLSSAYNNVAGAAQAAYGSLTGNTSQQVCFTRSDISRTS